MKKVVSREGRGITSLIVLFVSLLVLTPLAMADEAAPGAGGGGEGMLTRWMDNVAKPFKRLSNLTNIDVFRELSPADVGHRPRVRPHFNFNQGFTSNASIRQRQADPAWQARVAPGITVSIPSGKLYTEMDYTYGFSTTQGRRTHASLNTHNLSALARYDLSADTVFGVGNNFQISEVPGSGDATFMLETLTAQAKHRLGPKLMATLSDTFQWFRDESKLTSRLTNDFADNGVGAGLTYDATSDLSVGPSFNWNVRNFTHRNQKDYWQIQPNLNTSYKLGPKTTVGGNFGWAFRRFKDTIGSNSDRTESELVYGATASHLLGRKLVWSLSYAKSLQDTFDTSFVFKDTALATELDNLDRDFRVIKSHRLGSSATYHFDERNSFGIWGDFSFLSGARDDNVVNGPHNGKNNEKAMEVGAKYSYRINHYISFDVLYAFGRRFATDSINGNDDRRDYTFHKVTGGVNFTV